MKNIKTYIVEKLKISKNQKIKYTLFPKTRDELEEMIYKEIEENGNECSLNHIDVSKITNLSGLFTFFKDFNGDISEWDVSNVNKMDYMFYEAKFNGDIYNWDVSNVIATTMMFSGSEFNGDISEWDISNVEYMTSMFSYSNFNKDISKWDVSNVKNMEDMFNNAYKFNKDISEWQISSNCNVYNMFKDCKIKDVYKPFKNGKRI